MALNNLTFQGGSYGANPEKLPTSQSNGLPPANSAKAIAPVGNSNPNFTVTIQNVPYYMEIFLYNALESDGYKPVRIVWNIIDELSIEESFMTWIVKGYITLNSDFEVLERGALATATSTMIKAPYVFRTDGRNKISLRIRPLTEDKTYLDQDWEMSFDCVIYDVEDLDSDSNGRKLRRYYFWDERYQILTERNIDYASVYSNPNFTTSSGLGQQQRAYNPNLMLKDIITTAASNPPVMVKGITNTNTIKVGFDYRYKGESIANPTQSMANFDTKNWDNGDQGNLYFYVSPSNAKAIDDISHVLDYCVSGNQKGPVFLRFGRSANDKTWKLVSLASLFSQSQKNQIERFFIQDGIPAQEPYFGRSWIQPDGNNVNYVSPMGSRIQNYKYSPMVAADDARITNAPVHSYSFETNSWTINFAQNTAKAVRDGLESLGKLGLFNLTNANPNSSNAHVLLNLNQSKQNGTILKNVLMTSEYFPPNYTRNKMLKDALFLNEAISFDTFGSTLRTAGKFIFIDKTNSSTSNPFDDRFLGQWLTVKINHIFRPDDYTNNICAVKIDSNSKLWTQNDKTI